MVVIFPKGSQLTERQELTQRELPTALLAIENRYFLEKARVSRRIERYAAN